MSLNADELAHELERYLDGVPLDPRSFVERVRALGLADQSAEAPEAPIEKKAARPTTEAILGREDDISMTSHTTHTTCCYRAAMRIIGEGLSASTADAPLVLFQARAALALAENGGE